MDNLKEATELVRKTLLYMANRENPFDYAFKANIQENIQKDMSYTNDFIDYMYNCNFFKGENTTLPSLTKQGMQLAQDIANDEIWNEAMKVCDENKVYSLNAVMYAVTVIIRKRIDAELATHNAQ